MLVNLDRFELLYLLEGCARGSHLRQGIWEKLIVSIIPEMDDDEKDFVWWILRRDVWDIYNKPNSQGYYACGREDFNQAMAALHKNNYAMVAFENPDDKTRRGRVKLHHCVCYKYNGIFHPIGERMSAFIPNEWVKAVKWVEEKENKHVELKHLDWWKNDLRDYASKT